jgi:hypothetical protein
VALLAAVEPLAVEALAVEALLVEALPVEVLVAVFLEPVALGFLAGVAAQAASAVPSAKTPVIAFQRKF